MKSIITATLFLLSTVTAFAAADAVRVGGDLKVDGLHFSKDGSTMSTANDLLKNKGTWISSALYSAGDIVQAQSGSYICLTANTNISPPNATFWTPLGGAVGPVGPTGPANTLAIGTVVNGVQAAATLTGTTPNQTLNLTLPQGPQGPAGPACVGIPKVNVEGTTQQAVPNTQYMANNVSQVTITLPTSPAFGDTVKVLGVNTGGWKIAQNANQSIITKNMQWTPTGQSMFTWTSIASSSDGSKLAAIGTPSYGDTKLYTSTDSGTTWAATGPLVRWQSVTSSSDGSKLVAAVNGGQIFTSTDSGVTWTPTGPTAIWYSVASSSDGSKLVAVELGNGGGNGRIYTSTDSGATWTASGPLATWTAVASSSDGSKLVVAENKGQIYTSKDSGATWTPGGTIGVGYSIASSSDGSKLVAGGDLVYTSTDSGATWTPSATMGAGYFVASSSDGSKLVASGSLIYTSIDSGASWTPSSAIGGSGAIASSSDGSKLLAGANQGPLYRAVLKTTTGATGSMVGRQYDAVELQYIGNNTFTILSREGNIFVP